MPSMSKIDHDDHPHVITRNARNGLILFAIYVIFYGTFVYLSAFRADVMASRPFGGVNLAVLYGLGLIVAAFVLALVYMFLCRAPGRGK
ncbi:MAG: DUF485 domain-containing protein [Tepidisphaeraceae bacterium]